MKTKIKRKKDTSLSIDETISSATKHNSVSNNSLVNSQTSSITDASKKKRKLCVFSEDDSFSEEPKSKRKFKVKKGIESDNNSSSVGLVEEVIREGSEEDTNKQDNTPESLKKKKKHKKKKMKSNLITAQPNTSTLDYLSKWKNYRSQWKFEKVKQKRLISTMFDTEKLPNDYFTIFLEYMEGGSQSIKELLTKLANEVIDEVEKWESLSDAEKDITPKVNENKYERARTVLQMLQ